MLQQSSSLAGPWTNVGTAPTVNGQYQVTISSSQTAQFYRLIAQ
ncbi:MAG TPA: hypothetical protein VFC44_01390 [Candidatus Saccharimonadales bacterium]|nr:hypothetical protein [Candidatus Saccharimonadales bacterium]